MIVKRLEVGPLITNCYIVGCEETLIGAVIDPGGDADHIFSVVQSLGLTIKYIINTHSHFDHAAGNKRMKELTGADIVIHPLDAPHLERMAESAALFGFIVESSPKPDVFVEEGDVLSIGEIELSVLHTPGHTPGSISLLEGSCVFVGDLIFQGSIGRTDFPGGDYNTLINSVKTKIFTLDDDVVIYPGHGPETTVGREKKYNPFFTPFGGIFGV